MQNPLLKALFLCSFPQIYVDKLKTLCYNSINKNIQTKRANEYKQNGVCCMTEQKKKILITSGAAFLAVILAYCFRFIGKGSFYPTLFSYLRSFIYIGLFTAWGLSVRQRIVQKQVKKYLTGASVLLIFWIASRSAKYFIFWQSDAIRYLWYLFYLPMLFVPMLAVLIAMSLGKPDEYKLPRSTLLLWANSGTIPTEPIKEGSGLSSLRRSIESAGGEMHTAHKPRFALLITLPSKENDL